MAQISDPIIRAIDDNERQQVHTIMRQAFAPIEQWAFAWTPNVLVAEGEGQLLGAIVLKLFTLPNGRKLGSIAWVFIALESRGQGVGQRLIEAGLDFLEQQGCDEILTTVEGLNTSSSKLFSTRGFKILSPGAQFQRYGFATFYVWAKLSHYFELGYFLWAYPVSKVSDSPRLQWWGTIVANSLIGWLMAWRLAGFSSIHSESWWGIPLTVVVLFGVRSLGMGLMARRQKLAIRFRAWESGFLISAAIALVFPGAFYPIPGNVYPATHQWRYRDVVTQLGPIVWAGTLPVLLIVWGAWLLTQIENLPAGLEIWLEMFELIGPPLVLLDIAMPFLPFIGFNGRRLWDWRKPVWVVMTIAAVAVCLAFRLD